MNRLEQIVYDVETAVDQRAWLFPIAKTIPSTSGNYLKFRQFGTIEVGQILIPRTRMLGRISTKPSALYIEDTSAEEDSRIWLPATKNKYTDTGIIAGLYEEMAILRTGDLANEESVIEYADLAANPCFAADLMDEAEALLIRAGIDNLAQKIIEQQANSRRMEPYGLGRANLNY